eukprot:5995666-Prymnesium_polylepis.2
MPSPRDGAARRRPAGWASSAGERGRREAAPSCQLELEGRRRSHDAQQQFVPNRALPSRSPLS